MTGIGKLVKEIIKTKPKRRSVNEIVMRCFQVMPEFIKREECVTIRGFGVFRMVYREGKTKVINGQRRKYKPKWKILFKQTWRSIDYDISDQVKTALKQRAKKPASETPSQKT